MGKLKTYRLYERIKARAHLSKLNSETLRRAAPRLWARLEQHEEDLATDISQSVLVSHLDMIIQVLDFLGVPHEGGFFPKDANIAQHLTDGWQQRTFEQFQSAHPAPALLFYLNHLAWEVGKAEQLYLPAA